MQNVFGNLATNILYFTKNETTFFHPADKILRPSFRSYFDFGGTQVF